MTGYGCGKSFYQGTQLRAEISSVNRKQLEIAAQLPKEFIQLEPVIRELVSKSINRGRISVVITIKNTIAPKVMVDELLAAQVAKSMRQMKTRLKLPGEVTLEAVLRAPGVVRAAESEIDTKLAKVAVTEATAAALEDLCKMRDREGRHLANELNKHVAKLRKLSLKIDSLAPRVKHNLSQTLRARLKSLELSVPKGDERLQKEVAFYVEKSDITEEIARVNSHLAQMDELLKSARPIGRTIEFLLQELFREFNTMGAKAGDSTIARLAVESKSEVEKIREQSANIE